MKTTYLGILAFAVAILFTSCDKEDQDDIIDQVFDEAFYIGTWKLTGITTEKEYDLNNDGKASKDFMSEVDCYKNELLNLAISDKGFYERSSELEVNESKDGEQTVTCLELDENDPFTWKKEDGKIIIDNGEGDKIEATVTGKDLAYTVKSGISIGENDAITLKFIYTKQ